MTKQAFLTKYGHLTFSFDKFTEGYFVYRDGEGRELTIEIVLAQLCRLEDVTFGKMIRIQSLSNFDICLYTPLEDGSMKVLKCHEDFEMVQEEVM